MLPSKAKEINGIPIKPLLAPKQHKNQKSISIGIDLYNWLKTQGKFGESMDDLLKRLLLFKPV